MCNHNF